MRGSFSLSLSLSFSHTSRSLTRPVTLAGPLYPAPASRALRFVYNTTRARERARVSQRRLAGEEARERERERDARRRRRQPCSTSGFTRAASQFARGACTVRSRTRVLRFSSFSLLTLVLQPTCARSRLSRCFDPSFFLIAIVIGNTAVSDTVNFLLYPVIGNVFYISELNLAKRGEQESARRRRKRATNLRNLPKSNIFI